MAFTDDLVYDNFKGLLMRSSEPDLNASTAIRIMLVMTNTTCGNTSDDGVTLTNGFTTLDEFDGSGYTKFTGDANGGILLDSLVVTTDATLKAGKLDAADEVTAALGSGARLIAGIVVFRKVTNFANSIPYFYIHSGFPALGHDPAGGTLTFNWNANGILNITS